MPLSITMTTDWLARTTLTCIVHCHFFLYAQVHDDIDSIGWLTKLQTPEIIAELRAIGNVRLGMSFLYGVGPLATAISTLHR